MHRRHLMALDLNLLASLDVLLEECNVTLAATRVGITQPAMSRTLERLRGALGDPLLVRAGRTLVPTPRALAIKPALKEALDSLDAAVGGDAGFDPEHAVRTFHLATADYVEGVVLPAVMSRLSRFPGLELVVHPMAELRPDSFSTGMLDAVISPPFQLGDGFIWRKLFADELVCLVRRDHPRVRSTLSLKQYCELSHVMVAPRGGRSSSLTDALARRGLRRRVAVVVSSFLAAPLVVAETDLVATVGRRVAERAAAQLAVQLFAAPLSLPPSVISIGWHERMRHDPGHLWFRNLVVEAANAKPAPPPVG